MALPVKDRFSAENINRKINIVDKDEHKGFEYNKKTFYILGKSNNGHLLKKRTKVRSATNMSENQYIFSDDSGYLYEAVIGFKGEGEGSEAFLVSLETIPKS